MLLGDICCVMRSCSQQPGLKPSAWPRFSRSWRGWEWGWGWGCPATSGPSCTEMPPFAPAHLSPCFPLFIPTWPLSRFSPGCRYTIPMLFSSSSATHFSVSCKFFIAPSPESPPGCLGLAGYIPHLCSLMASQSSPLSLLSG